MIGKLIINAVNVHHGGGGVLLTALLNSPLLSGALVFIDARMQLPDDLNKSLSVVRVKPSILGRLTAELMIVKAVKPIDTLLCFGNLPPLFKVAGKVVVFIQNRYLIDPVPLKSLSIKVSARIRLERCWLRFRAFLVDEFIVQTATMNEKLSCYLVNIQVKSKLSIKILPFIGDSFHKLTEASTKSNMAYDFLYIASGEAHKNHRRLIEGWVMLAKEGIRPSLCLTINEKEHPVLSEWILYQKNIYQLNINNLGHVSQAQVNELYKCSSALIYPSVLESFGLPLVEAKQVGMCVLAGELDYVRDIIDPDEVFDPTSAVSISRSVKRFLEIKSDKLKIASANEFLTLVKNVDELR